MNKTRRPSIVAKCWRLCKRGLQGLLLLILLYALICLIGLIPVNNDFEPTSGGIEILVISNAIHADIVLPIDTDVIDWRDELPAECISGDTSWATHVAIGWGDKGFFIETPAWADLRASTAAEALLWPSDTCMHVSMTNADYLREIAREVEISQSQYRSLVEHIRASFQTDSTARWIPIEDAAYTKNDAFFEANGTYHGLNTCNCWAGRALQSAGIRMGWLTPLPKSVFLYLPDDNQ